VNTIYTSFLVLTRDFCSRYLNYGDYGRSSRICTAELTRTQLADRTKADIFIERCVRIANSKRSSSITEPSSINCASAVLSNIRDSKAAFKYYTRNTELSHGLSWSLGSLVERFRSRTSVPTDKILSIVDLNLVLSKYTSIKAALSGTKSCPIEGNCALAHYPDTGTAHI
jgi:hypothetical protein